MVDSITKTKISENQVIDLFKDAFGRGDTPESIEELKEGYFNTAYSITAKDGFKTILKIAPSSSIKLMRYEKDLMSAEVETLKLIKSNTEAPVPEVYVHSSKGNIIENEYFFMEYIAGIPYNKLQNSLSPAANESINMQLGRYTRSINSISGNKFGYISQEDRRCDTWFKAFTILMEDVLLDGEEADVELPVSYNTIREIIKSKKDILSTITKPFLLHKDLWAGNIFVDPASARITGIVDCERSLWGDPLMDFVFGFLEDNSAFNTGYGRTKASAPEELGLKSLYNLYLFLILVIECKYRLYPTDAQENWARTVLHNELKLLGGL